MQKPTVWFTADPHFGRANIVQYCHRPFLSAEEQAKAALDPRGKWKDSRDTIQRHDEALLSTINVAIQLDDEFWILDDLCLGKYKDAMKYVDRIACKNINFVWGNHDHRSIGPVFKKTIEQGLIKVNGQEIWLNHYPMRSWD